jgi:hypothetical protein
MDKTPKRHATVESNRVRLDVLAREPVVWQGLALDLKREAAAPRSGTVPLLAVLKNTGNRPLRLNLDKQGDTVLWDDILVCYDKAGTQIFSERRPGARSIERIRIEPGQEVVMKTSAPAGTALARLALYHKYLIKDQEPDEEVLGTGYAFSPHLVIPR